MQVSKPPDSIPSILLRKYFIKYSFNAFLLKTENNSFNFQLFYLEGLGQKNLGQSRNQTYSQTFLYSSFNSVSQDFRDELLLRSFVLFLNSICRHIYHKLSVDPFASFESYLAFRECIYELVCCRNYTQGTISELFKQNIYL